MGGGNGYVLLRLLCFSGNEVDLDMKWNLPVFAHSRNLDKRCLPPVSLSPPADGTSKVHAFKSGVLGEITRWLGCDTFSQPTTA